ncbi:MAG TPA: DUF1080 domain-containing protein [Steroidobacteraceae bacterium]|jgi:hypothetical protein|nr:DUF1080 domain-containing protein [Steroidobacteraceae bacterium]
MKHFAVWGFAVTALAGAPLAPAQDWIALQDGKTLAGWKAAERPESWVVEDGVFVSHGERAHLFYVGKIAKHDFRNFELYADVMTSPGANSGIYVHTKWQGPGFPAAGYELQVINSNPPAEKMNGYIEHKMTGSVYAVRNNWQAPVADNVWFSYRIRVVGKTIQTFINDELICEYAEPESPFRPDDKPGRLLGSGTFALQAHDPGSVVRYRNIKVRILPNDAAPPAGLVPLADRELDQLITQASNDNIPLIDFELTPPAGPEAASFWSDARRYGVLPLHLYDQPHLPPNVALFNDREKSPDPEALKKLKEAGYRFAFLSDAHGFDEAQLKRRLQTIKAAGLSWKDFWVPGKP